MGVPHVILSHFFLPEMCHIKNNWHKKGTMKTKRCVQEGTKISKKLAKDTETLKKKVL